MYMCNRSINNIYNGTMFILLKWYFTHCGSVTPHVDIELDQYWLRWCLNSWRHQAINFTIVDSSSARISDIHLREILRDVPHPPITTISLNTDRNSIQSLRSQWVNKTMIDIWFQSFQLRDVWLYFENIITLSKGMLCYKIIYTHTPT